MTKTFQTKTLVRLLVVLGLASAMSTAFAFSKPAPLATDGYYVDQFMAANSLASNASASAAPASNFSASDFLAAKDGLIEGRSAITLPNLR